MVKEVDFERRLGEWLVRERSKQKLTQLQLSQVLSMVPSQISAMEHGKYRVTAYQLYQLCFYLEAFPEELF